MHAILIFVPAIIIVSSFDIHFYQVSSLRVHTLWLPYNYNFLFTCLCWARVLGIVWLASSDHFVSSEQSLPDSVRKECWRSQKKVSSGIPIFIKIFLAALVSIISYICSTMTRLGTDYRLDAGLIACAILEFFLAIVTLIIAAKTICTKIKVRFFKRLLYLKTQKLVLFIFYCFPVWTI